MYIPELLNAGQNQYVSNLSNTTEKNKADDTEKSISSPASWGADTVSISPAARAAGQAADTADKNDQDSGQEEDAIAAFGEFMAKAKGKTPSEPGEQLDALKSKLVQLQSKKAQVLSSQELTEEAKQSQASVIDSQINQIMSLIAEMETQTAQSGGDGAA